MDQAIDRAGSLVAGYAHQILADLLRSGDVPHAEAASCAEKGWRVLVVACPAPPESVVPDLTPCERRCVELLAAADGPMSAERVYLALKRQGLRFHRITFKRALARLHGLGVLRNSRHKPRGYSFAEALPLFQQPRQE
jgi:hypothetical protein